MNRQQLKNVIQFVLAFAAVASGLAGCASPSPASIVATTDIVQSDRPRLQAQVLKEAQAVELVEGNTAFALDLYRELYNSEKNLLNSPFNLSLALAISYAGARGETEQQLAAATLHVIPGSTPSCLQRTGPGASQHGRGRRPYP